jgi:hypothetical protein
LTERLSAWNCNAVKPLWPAASPFDVVGGLSRAAEQLIHRIQEAQWALRLRADVAIQLTSRSKSFLFDLEERVSSLMVLDENQPLLEAAKALDQKLANLTAQIT